MRAMRSERSFCSYVSSNDEGSQASIAGATVMSATFFTQMQLLNCGV